VVVYIAPWCPACEASIGTLQEMNRLWNPSNSPYSHGIKVIVGRDDPAKCKAKAEQVGAFASVDTDDRFSKRHKIEGFPTWLVFNAQGDEIKRVGAAFPDAGQADLIAREVLKL
jgi:thiol-disulfide isomerase/thioredoxin